MTEYSAEFLLDESGRFQKFTGDTLKLFHSEPGQLIGTDGHHSLPLRVHRFFAEIHWASSTSLEPWQHSDHLADEFGRAYSVVADLHPVLERGYYKGVSGLLTFVQDPSNRTNEHRVLDQYRLTIDSARAISWQACVESDRTVFVSPPGRRLARVSGLRLVQR